MTKDDFLSHHGILGMKWGLRRYQNKDGTLTAAGKARYAKVAGDEKLRAKETKRAIEIATNTAGTKRHAAEVERLWAEKYRKKNELREQQYHEALSKDFLKEAGLMDQRVKDIKSGKVQAGRDYILQQDLYLRPASFLMSPWFAKSVRADKGKYVEIPLPAVEAETTFIDRKRN